MTRNKTLAFIACAGMAMPIWAPPVRAASADLGARVTLITKAEAYNRLCGAGDTQACAMIEAAAGANPNDPDTILNKPLKYGDTPQEIYEYFSGAGQDVIVKTEVME